MKERVKGVSNMILETHSNFLKLYSIAAFLIVFLISSEVVASPYREDHIKKQKMEAMYDSYKKEAFPDIRSLSVELLLTWQEENEKIVFVDVRTPKERKVSMIPSAIPIEEFEKNLEKYKDYKIVYYCTIGYRSGLLTKEAEKKSLNAYNLRGGVLAWAHAGQKFVDSEGEPLNVPVYGKKWNLTPQGYHAVW
jgi:rhodanese-related sulfurtransferase